MSSSTIFCRLCLQKYTGPFKILNKDPKASTMVQHLFPGMNIDLVETSKICSECFKHIQFSYTMRETVIKNEQKVNSNMASVCNIEKNTCRLCLTTESSEGKVFLYENVNQTQTMSFLEARTIVEIAIIQMHFEIFKKPVVCNSCWQIVRLIYLFKKRCFATEKVLKFYCTENNLTSLTNQEIESVSICYNTNLEKFSICEKLDLSTNHISTEDVDNASQTISTSIGSIIKPVDVYLNNFTNEDEDDTFDEEVDDTFEEEIDDIFVESPKIVKEELLDTSIATQKEEREEHSTILNGSSENLDEIKKEEIAALNADLKNINNDVQGDIKNTQRNEVSEKKSEGILSIANKKSIKITSAKVMKKVSGNRINSNLEKTVHSRISEEAEFISKANYTVIENHCSENINSLSFEGNSKDTENHNVDNSEKKLDHVQTGQKKSENTKVKIKFRKLDKYNHKKAENQEETRKHVAKRRKKPLEKSKDINESTNSINNLENNSEEASKPAGKKRKKFKNLEVIKVSKNEKKTSKVIGENKDVEKRTIPTNLGDVEWTCTECEFKTKYKQHLKRHSFIHNQNSEMSCYKCVYSTCIKRNLVRHMLKHNSENFVQCSFCTYSTLSRWHLKTHMLIHEKNDGLKEQDWKQGCHRDVETEQLKQPFDFRCKDCPFVTSKEAQIVAHLRAHKSREKIFKCTECHYITPRSHSLKNHMELHNKDPPKKNFKCKICPFTGKRYTHLVSHMLSHQEECKFSCSQCSYKAKKKSHLVTHMLLHQDGDKKVLFQCPYCKYSSIRREHLNLHRRNVHYDKEEVNNEAPLTMKEDKNGSNKHNKILKCPYCSYRGYCSSLEVHIFAGHFPSRTDLMECNQCSFKTDKRKGFLRHVNSHQKKRTM